MTGDVPISTSDRILDASLQLFNQRGLQDVPAMRIAMHLGMSPGHLAYHFKTKNDIVVAVFGRLEREISQTLLDASQPGRPFLPKDAAAHQLRLLRAMWRYRFFFDALTELLVKNPSLRERYMHMHQGIIDSARQLFDDLIERGFMVRVTAPNTTVLLARSVWLIWMSWVRFEQIENPSADGELRPESLYDGVIQMYTVVQPYFSSEFGHDMLTELRRQVLGEPRAGSSTSPGPVKLRKKAVSPQRNR